MRAVSLGVLALCSVGCDQGRRDEQPAHGPALHVIATYPADGQGTNTGFDAGVACDTPTPDCAVPINLEIELRFDRFLLPVAFESAIRLFSGDPGANQVSLSASYDLLERVVVLHPSRTLNPNTLYTVEITPSSNPNQGFWAFDRAPLESGPVPLRFSFTTGSTSAAQNEPPPLNDNCQTITAPPKRAGSTTIAAGPLFGCASCHVTPPATPPTDSQTWVDAYPPMGLVISDWGLATTAIGHVAHETATGMSQLDPGRDGAPRFGVEMNLVQRGSPENSYLMYKLLRKPANYTLDGHCGSRFHPPVSDAACTAPGNDELTRLSEWFVLGDPMPEDLNGAATSLSWGELVRVASWIGVDSATCVLP